MADWRDVMHAQAEANHALGAFDRLMADAEESPQADATAIVGLATTAICLELRALSVGLAYEIGSSAGLLGRE